MKASGIKRTTPGRKKDAKPARGAKPEDEPDLTLLEESLTKTAWERMQANDDALHLADLLKTAMLNRTTTAGDQKAATIKVIGP